MWYAALDTLSLRCVRRETFASIISPMFSAAMVGRDTLCVVAVKNFCFGPFDLMCRASSLPSPGPGPHLPAMFAPWASPSQVESNYFWNPDRHAITCPVCLAPPVDLKTRANHYSLRIMAIKLQGVKCILASSRSVWGISYSVLCPRPALAIHFRRDRWQWGSNQTCQWGSIKLLTQS